MAGACSRGVAHGVSMERQTVGSEKGLAGTLENGMSMLGLRLRWGLGGRGWGRTDQEAGPGLRIVYGLEVNELLTEESCAECGLCTGCRSEDLPDLPGPPLY